MTDLSFLCKQMQIHIVVDDTCTEYYEFSIKFLLSFKYCWVHFWWRMFFFYWEIPQRHNMCRIWLFGVMTFSLVESHGSRHCWIHLHIKSNVWMQRAQERSRRDFQRKSQNEVGVDWIKLKESGQSQNWHCKTSHFWQWYPWGSTDGEIGRVWWGAPAF